MKGFIIGLMAITFFSGCGSGDYEEDLPPVAPPEVKADSPKEELARVTVGALTDVQNSTALKGLSVDAQCPSDTVCIRGKSMGEIQLGRITVDHPDLLTLTSAPQGRVYRIKTSAKVRIEAETKFDVAKEIIFESCSPRLEIFSNEVSGTGSIISSAVNCETKNGGDIILISPKVSALRIVANGAPGKPGENAKAPENERRAANGDTKKFEIHVYYDYRNLTLLLAGWGNEETRKTAFQELQSHGLFSESDFENYLNEALKDRAKGADRWYQSPFLRARVESYKFARSGDSQANSQEETGAFYEAEGRLENVETLNGSPATKIWSGGDGESGGNAGVVHVISLNSALDNSMVQAIGGKGGDGGSAVGQLPGLGVEPEMKARSWDFPMKFLVWVRYDRPFIPALGPAEVKLAHKLFQHQYSGIFKLGGQSRYERQKGYYGELLGQEKLRGQDGAPLSEEKIAAAQGKKGVDGLSPEVKIEQLPIEAVWVRKAKDVCSDINPEKFLSRTENEIKK